MKKRWSKNLLSTVFIGLFIYYYASNPEVFVVMRDFGLALTIFGVVYSIITIINNGLFIKLAVNSINKEITHFGSIYASFLASFSNYFLPIMSGAAIKAVYLRRKYQLSYKDFTSTLYGNYIFVFLTTSSISLLSIYMIYLDTGTYSWMLIIPMLGMLILTLILIFTKPSRLIAKLDLLPTKLLKSTIGKITRVLEGWEIIIKDKKLLIQLVVINVLNILLRSLFFYAVFRSMGNGISIWHSLLFTSITVFGVFFAFTPGGIGIRETILIIYAGSLTLDKTSILSATLLDRATSLIALLVMFVFFRIVTHDRITSYRTNKRKDHSA